MEIWKDIQGYEGLYQVSNLGRVQSLIGSGKILKGSINNNGYIQVALSYTKFLVHRLVAQHFLPNLFNWTIVNHKDDNPLNNAASNLEWCTQSYNMLYSTKRLGSDCYRATITEKQAKEVFNLHRRGFQRVAIANLTNIRLGIVTKIVKGESWNQVTGLPRKRYTTPKAA